MKKAGISFLLFLLALVPRILALDLFLTADEPTLRIAGSIRFVAGLSRGELAATYQFHHPGVTTLWAGAMGLGLAYLKEPSLVAPLLENAFGEEAHFLDLLYPRTLQLLPAMRFPVVVLTAAFVAGVYLLVRRLWRAEIAILAALLLAFDPFFLAHSRLFHTDPLLTIFITLSLLFALLYLKEGRASFLVVAGFMAGLALLSKVSALVLLPLMMAFFIWEWIFHQNRTATFPAFLLWLGSAALTFFLLWPAMWVAPLSTLYRLVHESFRLAATPLAHSNFFLGRATPDPGPLFYPVALLFRTTPLTLLGALASLCLLPFNSKERKGTAYLWLYILSFTLLISLPSQKLDRYLLPLLPSLEIAAAVGIYRGGELLAKPRVRRYFFPLSCVFILALQAAFSLPHHPYYLTYYSPLLGGPKKATQVLLVGWGEGLDQAARYLNQKEEAPQLKVATWYEQVFRPYFQGETIPLEFYQPKRAHYVILYINDLQRRLHPAAIDEYYGQMEPEYVVRLKGVDYALIYHAP